MVRKAAVVRGGGGRAAGSSGAEPARSTVAAAGRGGSRASAAEQLRQRHRVERVAEKLFAEGGFKGTSTHLVAARAGCSVGHLYNLYGSKLGLYQAIFQSKLTRLRGAALETVSASGSVQRRLQDLIRGILGYFEENSAFFRIYLLESDTRVDADESLMVDDSATLLSDPFAVVTGLLREGQENGELRADFDPHLAAVSLVGMLKGHALEWVWQGEKGSLRERDRALLDLILQGMSGGEERA